MADDQTTTQPAQHYVRPEHLQPQAANPFDNGTAEPAPPLGQPNGVPLEDVLAMTPPSVYERPEAHDVVTAKAAPDLVAQADAEKLAAQRAQDGELQDAAALAQTPGELDPAAYPAPPAPTAESSGAPDVARPPNDPPPPAPPDQPEGTVPA